jgi:hypothetical protein
LVRLDVVSGDEQEFVIAVDELVLGHPLTDRKEWEIYTVKLQEYDSLFICHQDCVSWRESISKLLFAVRLMTLSISISSQTRIEGSRY